MKNIPVTLVNDRLLIKNIVDFYRAKGTEKAYKMLFRMLYGDESVSFYYPGKDILRASDGKWVIERSLKVDLSAPLNSIEDLIVIRGITSNATARKDKFLSYVINEVKTDELFINNLFGEFIVGEQILNDDTGEELGYINSTVTYPGSWIGTDGFLSSDKYLQDNFFYQEYSYQIRSSHSISEYEDIAKALAHPAGTMLFGAVDMFALLDFSDITVELVSNLGNVGDVSKITISYQLELNENPNLGIVSNNTITTTVFGAMDSIDQRNGQHIYDRFDNQITLRIPATAQFIRNGELLVDWLDYTPFDDSFADIEFALLTDYVIFRSSEPTFTFPNWTPITIIDQGNSANTTVFAKSVVNTSIVILSTEYPFGLTDNLSYKYYEFV